MLSKNEIIYISPNVKISKKAFSEKQDGGYLSYISKYKNGKLVSTEYFENKDFTELYRIAYIKYLKNGNRILLRKYNKLQEGIFSEIEKSDKDKNSIYKKQYKFKGILAHILFWLAR